MPRHPRVHAPGLLFHLMARGNNVQTVFGSDKDYEAFLDQLRVVRGRYPFYLYAYAQPLPLAIGGSRIANCSDHAIAAYRLCSAF